MNVITTNIKEILSKNSSSFFIPPFQRAYSWGKQEIDRYFDDIVRIIESERNQDEMDKLQHFFGVLVLKNEEEGFSSRHVVIDGQQRLTTTLLLLIAVRDRIDDDDTKRNLEGTFLRNQSSTYSDKIKLKQVTKDWDAYRALINCSERVPNKITDGYDYISSMIKIKNFGAMDYILALSRMNVACIFLDERAFMGEDPQIIFETLNSLGKPLTFADLIRNYILLGLKSDDQTKAYEEIWYPQIESILHIRTSHFFRDLMQYKQSKNFKVVSDNNTKELYALFTKFVNEFYDGGKNACIVDAVRYVALYRWINEVELTAIISQNVDKNKIIVELLRNIFHDIKTEAFKPVVLGLLGYHQFGLDGKKLSDEQLIEALTVILTYLVRRRVLKISQGENKDIPILCDDIKKRYSFLLTDARKEMLFLLSGNGYNLRIPNDVEIASGLRGMDFYNSMRSYSKFILGKIEEMRSKVSVDFRNKKITIEHIMPQSIERSKHWQNELGDDWNDTHKEFRHNIGNLILTEFNESMGNKSFAKKKEQLANSNLQYRLDIINNETWNRNNILEHQRKMIERFLAAFSLPAEMQQAENWDSRKPLSDYDRDSISLFDDSCSEIVTGRKPKALIIYDELVKVSDWQGAYLEFWRWLLKNNPVMFGSLLKQEPNGTYPLIATKSSLITIVEIDESAAGKYKRLIDGLLFSKVKEEVEENPIYIHINQSAASITNNIREVMVLSEMSEESVIIQLRPSAAL